MTTAIEAGFDGSPYLDPSNVNFVDGEPVSANGPHGMEFPLSEHDRAIVRVIQNGLKRSYRDELAAWQQSTGTHEVTWVSNDDTPI